MTSINVKAAVCRSFDQPLAIETIQVAPPQAHQVRIRLKACAICHSDISIIKGKWGGSELPLVAGHEAAGIVTDVGDNVNSVQVGDTVVVTWVHSCGQCAPCSAGHQVSCDAVVSNQSPLSSPSGENIGQALGTGAFAESVVVHHSQIVKIPTSLPLVSAALLGCGVLTGFCSVTNVAKMPRHSKVVVIGTGGLGLNALQAAHIAQASPLIAVDIVDEKLQAARDFGATHTINAKDGNPVEQVLAICESGVDFVFVTAGSSDMFTNSLAMLCKYGTSVIVGMPAESDKSFAVDSHQLTTGRNLLGSRMGDTNIQQDIPELIRLYQNGQLKLDELVTSTYALEDINLAIDEVLAGRALRNVILF